MVSLNLPVAIFSWSWTNVLRVSIATWLQNKDYFEFERALVLNHAANNVTGGGIRTATPPISSGSC
jgi:hypothetical protein